MSANRIASGLTSERLRSASMSRLLGGGNAFDLVSLWLRAGRGCIPIARDDQDARARLTHDAIKPRVVDPSRRHPSFWRLVASRDRTHQTFANLTNDRRIP